MAGSPTVRRRRLLRELQRLRHATGKTIDEIADEVGMSKSTLSRIENGQVGVKLPLLRSLLDCYGVTSPEADAIRQLHREANQRGWWQEAEAPVSEMSRMLAGLEDEADEVNIFQSALVPGLLQTPAYAMAVLQALAPDRSADTLKGGIEFRIRRQQRVGQFRLWVILAEEVLLRPIGGAAVMSEQIQRIVEVSRGPRTTVQVLPLSAGAHAGIAGSFSVLSFDAPQDPDVVYYEGAAGERYAEDPGVVLAGRRRFDLLRATALSPAESIQLLDGRK